MRQVILIGLMLVTSLSIKSQSIGIGTDFPNQYAILDAFANDKGILIPRLTLSERNTNLSAIGSTENGLLIYNTTDLVFNYWDGTQWLTFPSNDHDWHKVNVSTGTDLGQSDNISNDIYTTGSVGIGTLTPNEALQVSGNVRANAFLINSDLRYKKDINVITNSLDKVNELKGVTYLLRVKEFPELKFSNTKQIGLIAQDVEKVLPELVHCDDNGYKSVNYAQLTAVLVEAIKEQQLQIESLQEKNKSSETNIQEMKVENTDLMKRLESIEEFMRHLKQEAKKE